MTPSDLRAWLEQNRLTQTDLANKFNVSINTVNRWATGKVPIPAIVPLACKAIETHPPPAN